MKVNGEVPWCGVNGIITGVQEMERAMEGVAILLNNASHSTVIDFGCFSSRIRWIKFKFSRVKVCMVVGYGHSEGNGEERDLFWNDMDRILDRVVNVYRLCILGDLNGYIGNRTRVSITGAFEIPRENDNG